MESKELVQTSRQASSKKKSQVGQKTAPPPGLFTMMLAALKFLVIPANFVHKTNTCTSQNWLSSTMNKFPAAV
jgi:hypothetical protein